MTSVQPSDDEVANLIAGKQTELRRPVEPQPDAMEPAVWMHTEDGHSGPGWHAGLDGRPDEGALHYLCPFGKPGTLLWVQETHVIQAKSGEDHFPDCDGYEDDGDDYVDCLGCDPWEYEQALYRATPRVGLRRWISPPQIGQERPHGLTYLHPSTPLNRGPAHHVEQWSDAATMPRWAARLWLRVVKVRVERLHAITLAGADAEGVPSYKRPRAYWESWDARHPAHPCTGDPWTWVARVEVASTTGRPT